MRGRAHSRILSSGCQWGAVIGGGVLVEPLLPESADAAADVDTRETLVPESSNLQGMRWPL